MVTLGLSGFGLICLVYLSVWLEFLRFGLVCLGLVGFWLVFAQLGLGWLCLAQCDLPVFGLAGFVLVAVVAVVNGRV